MSNEYGGPGGFDPMVKDVLDVAVSRIPGLQKVLTDDASRAAVQGTINTMILVASHNEHGRFLEALQSKAGQMLITAAGPEVRQLADERLPNALATHEVFSRMANDLDSDFTLKMMLGLSGIEDVDGALKQLRAITAEVYSRKPDAPNATVTSASPAP